MTPEEVQHIWKKLQMKYGAEIQSINEKIEQDIRQLGYVSLLTDKLRKKLSKKMNEEKDNYEQYQDS